MHSIENNMGQMHVNPQETVLDNYYLVLLTQQSTMMMVIMMMINSQFNKQSVKESVTSFWLMNKSAQLYWYTGSATAKQPMLRIKSDCDNDLDLSDQGIMDGEKDVDT